MNKLKGLLINNILIKLLAVFIAFMIWMVVVNIENPTQSRNFTSSVTILNEEFLTNQGKYYTIPDGGNTITFRVTAPRNIIERLSSEDFTLVADMENVEGDSRIPVEISAKNYASAISISSKQQYLYISVGTERVSEFIVNPITTGDPADGFVVDTLSAEPNVISVKGPETIVSSIDRIEAVCDVSGLSMNTKISVVPVLLDVFGTPIDTTRLNLSVQTVDVEVYFTNIKSVPIILEDKIGDNTNVELVSADINPSPINILGNSNILNDITEIVIPSTVIDLSTIAADVTTTVDITRYLPEGVRLQDDKNANVTVSIRVTSHNEKIVEVPTSHITVRNLAEGQTAQFDSNSISVTVTGLPSALDKIDGNDVTGSVDVSGLNEGTHIVRVVFDSDDRFSTDGFTVTAKVIISGNR